jgi:hypothetical protein
MAAQVAAEIPSERLPASVGEAYNPPAQLLTEKYCLRRSARFRYSTTDAPLGP